MHQLREAIVGVMGVESRARISVVTSSLVELGFFHLKAMLEKPLDKEQLVRTIESRATKDSVTGMDGETWATTLQAFTGIKFKPVVKHAVSTESNAVRGMCGAPALSRSYSTHPPPREHVCHCPPRSKESKYGSPGKPHITLGRHLEAINQLESVTFPANMFAEIRFKERLRLQARKQFKTAAFSKIFTIIFNWTLTTFGFVNVDDLWLEKIEGLFLVRAPTHPAKSLRPHMSLHHRALPPIPPSHSVRT